MVIATMMCIRSAINMYLERFVDAVEDADKAIVY